MENARKMGNNGFDPVLQHEIELSIVKQTEEPELDGLPTFKRISLTQRGGFGSIQSGEISRFQGRSLHTSERWNLILPISKPDYLFFPLKSPFILAWCRF